MEPVVLLLVQALLGHIYTLQHTAYAPHISYALQALLGWSGMQFLELEINPEYFTQEREAAAAAAAASTAQLAATGRARSFYLRRQGSSTSSSGELLDN